MDTVKVDSGIPTMTGLQLSQTIVRSVDGRFTATWSATDNIGVTRYEWRTRKSPDGTPSTPISTTGRSGSFLLGAGAWYLDVRARDAVGNASPWRSVRVIVPRDDRAFSFSGGTTRRTGSTYYRSTLTTTNVKRSQLATESADATMFVLIGRVGPTYGKFEVTVDGATTVIDSAYLRGTRVTSNHDRVLLFSARLTPGAHTVTIRNLATTGRPTIAIDGIAWAR
jgi:hypothetical protein